MYKIYNAKKQYLIIPEILRDCGFDPMGFFYKENSDKGWHRYRKVIREPPNSLGVRGLVCIPMSQYGEILVKLLKGRRMRKILYRESFNKFDEEEFLRILELLS